MLWLIIKSALCGRPPSGALVKVLAEQSTTEQEVERVLGPYATCVRYVSMFFGH